MISFPNVRNAKAALPPRTPLNMMETRRQFKTLWHSINDKTPLITESQLWFVLNVRLHFIVLSTMRVRILS